MSSIPKSDKTADTNVGGFFCYSQRTWPLFLLALLMVLAHGKAFLPAWQYGFRDAAHFYYPLNQRVQMEWDAGRWPLWEPEENAGMPLLGNPTAAVFYPLKIVFFLFSYPLAAKAYIWLHQILAWCSMARLSSGLGCSKVASCLGACAYAFGVPILFQYCNIIFLIGAAWLPLGFLYGWKWINQGGLANLAGLSLVIAMQILGGDPQVGYLTLLCLFGLAFWEGLSPAGRNCVEILFQPLLWLVIVCFIVLGVIVSAQFPIPPRQVRLDGPGLSERILLSRSFWHAFGWGSVGLYLLNKWRRTYHKTTAPHIMAGLVLAMITGAGLSAVQLLPVSEYNALSVRSAAEGPHDIFPFSLEPYRVFELVWPNLFGSVTTANRSWVNLLPPISNHKEWVPSLYHGLPAMLLALAVFGFRRAEGQVRAASILLCISLLGSMGEFTSPLWLMRRLPIEPIKTLVGNPDTIEEAAIRKDGLPRDGAGSLYGLMAEIFPALRTFRYPSKLLTFTSLAIALLCGFGWDQRNQDYFRRRLRLINRTLAVSSVFGLIAWIAMRKMAVAWMRNHPAASSIYGPLIADEAWLLTALAFVQTLLVLGLFCWLMWKGAERKWMIPALFCVVSIDLAVANVRHVRLVPQALFDRQSKVVQLIREAEKQDPTPGGYYRIHRMPIWNPPAWNLTQSPDRVRDFVDWEHTTIQPKYGITMGVDYTLTEGTTELYDYWWFFGPFYRRFTPETARSMNATAGEELAYHPRRGFDMWNTRYFVTPGFPGDWKDHRRSYASFMYESEIIYPNADLRKNPARKEEFEKWAKEEDLQIIRNKAVYPRAWIVHEMRVYPHVSGLNRRERESVMSEILFPNDPFWRDPGREVYDPRVLAWVDQQDQDRVRPFMVGRVRAGSSESVVIDSHTPQRVEMTAQLERPGMVILADVYYPGWKLTVDGKPEEIVLANRGMRGALVQSGKHKLVYTYEPDSFRRGALISAMAVAVWGLLIGLNRKWPGRKSTEKTARI